MKARRSDIEYSRTGTELACRAEIATRRPLLASIAFPFDGIVTVVTHYYLPGHAQGLEREVSARDDLGVLEPLEQLQAHRANTLRVGARDTLQHARRHLRADLPIHIIGRYPQPPRVRGIGAGVPG